MFGKYMTDSTAARAHGLPPSGYVRSEPMSDALHTMLFNPYFLITELLCTRRRVLYWNPSSLLCLELPLTQKQDAGGNGEIFLREEAKKNVEKNYLLQLKQ